MKIGKQTMGLLLSFGDVAADRLLSNFPNCTYVVRVCKQGSDSVIVWDCFHELGFPLTMGENDGGRQCC